MNRVGVVFLLSICTLTAFPDLIDLQKLMRLTSYKRCSFDSDCKENSFCFGNDQNTVGNCKCKDNYFLDRNRSYYECFAAGRFGDPCNNDFHCQILMTTYAICTEENLCACGDNSHLAPDGRCYHTAKLTEPCAIDNNCLLSSGSFAFCTSGHCQCPLLHHPAEDLLSCIPSVRLGDPCESDESCIHTHANCYGVCRCVPGYAVSQDGRRCLKAAWSFGEGCQEDVQCSTLLEGSVCYEGNCTCHVGYHGYGTACYRTAFLGQMCENKRECVVVPQLDKSVDCVDGACACLTTPSDDFYGCSVGDSGAGGYAGGLAVIFGVLWTIWGYV